MLDPSRHLAGQASTPWGKFRHVPKSTSSFKDAPLPSGNATLALTEGAGTLRKHADCQLDVAPNVQ